MRFDREDLEELLLELYLASFSLDDEKRELLFLGSFGVEVLLVLPIFFSLVFVTMILEISASIESRLPIPASWDFFRYRHY